MNHFFFNLYRIAYKSHMVQINSKYLKRQSDFCPEIAKKRPLPLPYISDSKLVLSNYWANQSNQTALSLVSFTQSISIFKKENGSRSRSSIVQLNCARVQLVAHGQQRFSHDLVNLQHRAPKLHDVANDRTSSTRPGHTKNCWQACACKHSASLSL